ncbi:MULTISPECIES: GntR family transcriptional regulator [unclassified Streptomyces]|uniref:GntR family transcriptional regulator n=1 Tax=unclassified Streptomyces TaxID=2593676 RepID=UPI001660FF6B|nr:MULTISPECIES: GntR family transcriptional regulator [unclassified Streptomyces]MBD0707969.1 GntR family transcriptional regulator [Streptomyces sp. CBMA291]MBD0715937.1 GntR family transcriptional regulator [Streptomyces sp. CBMA370]
MTDQDSPRRPKYQRIADELRTAIQSGEFAPGDRLPGENDLMATYGVARMTVRQALSVLRNEGLAEARKGAGVFVRAFRPLRRRGIPRLSGERWTHGHSIWSADVPDDRDLLVDRIEVTEGPAGARVAEALGLPPGAPVCVRSRRFVLDAEPVLLSVSYLPAALVRGTLIAEMDTGPGGTYARLTELGQRPVRFREEIRCRMPTADESQLLGLASGTPVVLIGRTAYTAPGVAVELNEMTLDSSAYVLEYEFGA